MRSRAIVCGVGGSDSNGGRRGNWLWQRGRQLCMKLGFVLIRPVSAHAAARSMVCLALPEADAG
eukprot:1357550-Lingulodinium_polyedra.AAC.1